MLDRLAEKSQQIQDLQRDKSQLEETLTQRSSISLWLLISDRQNRQLTSCSSCSENRCAELREELANQKAKFCCQLQHVRVEFESEGGALRGRLEQTERERDGETTENCYLFLRVKDVHTFCVC